MLYIMVMFLTQLNNGVFYSWKPTENETSDYLLLRFAAASCEPIITDTIGRFVWNTDAISALLKFFNMWRHNAFLVGLQVQLLAFA